MRRSNRYLLPVLAIAAGALLSACGDDGDSGGGEANLANPASVFCVDQGGESIIDGGAGICKLPDGTEIDEWEYYRENHESVGIANPASVFCVDQGGESIIDGGAGICKLPDGTEIDEWEYYRENHDD